VFELLVASGRGALESSDAERAAALLGEALGLWRGPLFADVPRTSLLETQADRAEELRLAATELRIEADLACGRASHVIPELRSLVGEHPLREGFWALLMRALEAAGRHAEALDVYGQAQQVISEELGVDPGTELRRLFRELLAADSATVTRPKNARSSGTGVPPRPRSGDAASATQRTPGPPAARVRHGRTRRRPPLPVVPRVPRPSARIPRRKKPLRHRPVPSAMRQVPSPSASLAGFPLRRLRPRRRSRPPAPPRDCPRSQLSFPRTLVTSPDARRTPRSYPRCCSARRRRPTRGRCG